MMLQHPQFPEDHSTAAMALAPTDMTPLDWQKARLKWLQQQPHPSYFTAGAPTTADLRPNPFFALPASTAAFHTCSSAFGDEKGSVAHDLSSNMSPDLIHYPMFGGCFVGGGEGSIHEARGRSLLRTFSCLPVMGDEERKATPTAAASPFDKGHGASLAAAAAAQHPTEGGRESSRKRKAAYEVGFQEPDSCYIDALVEPKLETPSISSTTVNTTADGKDHKPTSNKEASSYTSKDKCSKVSDPSPKTDYIHVRARRGQATDNHSLAERARREKISKRMKLLQELVPGCSKITGKAGVLDEIINYVQSLQRQVEFLSMKLAAVNPTLDSNIDALLMSKEMSPHHRGGMVPSSVGTDLPSEPLDASFLNHVNTMKAQLAAAAAMAVECSGALEVAVSSSCPDEQASLFHRTPRAPVLSASECCSAMDPYEVHGQAPTYPWEADWQSHYSVYELQQLGLGVGAAP